MRFVFGLLLITSWTRADSLADLRSLLASIRPISAIVANVSYKTSNQAGDDKTEVEGKVTAVVEDSASGLQIRWPRDVMELAVAEEIARATDRNKKAPTRAAMDSLNATTLNDYLNAGPQMLRQLGQAELIDDKAVVLNGQPARLLSLKVTPTLGEKDKKYIKEIETTAKIWLDAEGWPIAAEHSVHIKGRALLVITFEQSEHHEVHYARANGRLVATSHAKESNNSGAGESMHSKTLATLELMPANEWPRR
jgi:hypothetical protein